MHIHRSNSKLPPYNITFECDKRNGFAEHLVAASALGINEGTKEDLGLCKSAADMWAHLSTRIRYQKDETLQTERMTLRELKIMGTTLLHFSDRTEEDLSGSFAPNNISAANRRVDGIMASTMAATIANRGIVIARLDASTGFTFMPWYPS